MESRLPAAATRASSKKIRSILSKENDTNYNNTSLHLKDGNSANKRKVTAAINTPRELASKEQNGHKMQRLFSQTFNTTPTAPDAAFAKVLREK